MFCDTIARRSLAERAGDGSPDGLRPSGMTRVGRLDLLQVLRFIPVARQGERAVANEDRIIAVYMMANRKNGTLYVGVTSHLVQRTWQHREGTAAGFTKKHGCKTLVWYEVHEWIEAAIAREKSLKSYRRQNKINLIEKVNPDWKDLWFEITG